ncbi:hypothetical protein BKK79_04365 [Cupriavidus sp. USMAA2-4]|uniref:HTH luxR-type domain-containing protein n=1 Tax=Cupriavidus malaysiensis TaxID=367825 RepID=A0ABM6F3D5_9BURK|nr:hypothetical protein BKK79_04365 [Cupriavidus sp. USMAA2-4]AOY99293.1 hypothetical protein BKK81_08465 [Cupriavidus sp. USMAHM13]AOZ05717.1 hypothetical protein BKK80_07775 [Cupriavidus malaysiensis]
MANPSPPRLAAAPPGTLTARERQVLRWLARGKTDRDIASVLGISTRTVQKHLQHVYVKLGVETRTAAVVRGMGWLPADDAADAGCACQASENAL